MNTLKHYNNAMRYIEDHLESEIDYATLCHIACTPEGLFQRIFAAMSDLTLSEYIRRRRLSQAAKALKQGQKVIDVAIHYGYESSDAFTYLAGYDVANIAAAHTMGLDLLEAPEAEYAIFTLVGPIPHSITQAWKYVAGTFFPEQGYRHAGTPDFEVYLDGDMYADDYTMELWVPIVKDTNS
ncbi:MAG: hypothetical protein CSA82_00785 [Actinobacteria bacterium]|nr:MAG: hypothetical protein CSA82_00785 [Actinomycetota bacterium]